MTTLVDLKRIANWAYDNPGGNCEKLFLKAFSPEVCAALVDLAFELELLKEGLKMFRSDEDQEGGYPRFQALHALLKGGDDAEEDDAK